MKPWLVNPNKLIVSARKLAREWEKDQNGLTKNEWSPAERGFYDTVIRYEKSLFRGGPKKKASKK